MPIIKRAIKKLRHDRKRTKERAVLRDLIKRHVKLMRSKPSEKALTQVYRTIDKGAKHHIIHPNKAARLKARLAKLLKK